VVDFLSQLQLPANFDLNATEATKEERRYKNLIPGGES
jgi:hypothetical protein